MTKLFDTFLLLFCMVLMKSMNKYFYANSVHENDHNIPTLLSGNYKSTIHCIR